MFETVGVMAVSACILQMVYEKIEKQRPVVDYTEENKKFREQKEQEAKEQPAEQSTEELPEIDVSADLLQ